MPIGGGVTAAVTPWREIGGQALRASTVEKTRMHPFGRQGVVKGGSARGRKLGRYH